MVTSLGMLGEGVGLGLGLGLGLGVRSGMYYALKSCVMPARFYRRYQLLTPRSAVLTSSCSALAICGFYDSSPRSVVRDRPVVHGVSGFEVLISQSVDRCFYAVRLPVQHASPTPACMCNPVRPGRGLKQSVSSLKCALGVRRAS